MGSLKSWSSGPQSLRWSSLRLTGAKGALEPSHGRRPQARLAGPIFEAFDLWYVDVAIVERGGHVRLRPNILDPLLLKVDSLALVLSEGARRVLVISSP